MRACSGRGLRILAEAAKLRARLQSGNQHAGARIIGFPLERSGIIFPCAVQQPSSNKPFPLCWHLVLLLATLLHFNSSRLCAIWCFFLYRACKIPIRLFVGSASSLLFASSRGKRQCTRQNFRRRSWTSCCRAPKYRRSRGIPRSFFLHRTEMSCDNSWGFPWALPGVFDTFC